MSLDPALLAQLQNPAVILFVAVEIDLPGYPLRLVDGAGFVSFGGNTYHGRDDTYGALGAIEAIGDGVANDAPTVKVNILPPTNTASADLCDPLAQGSAVSIWSGALDPVTGLAVGAPFLHFAGEVDVPTLSGDRGSRNLEYECTSVWARLFAATEGARLSDAFHQSVWPGELGMEYVTAVQRQLPWGADAPRSTAITDVAPAGLPYQLLNG